MDNYIHEYMFMPGIRSIRSMTFYDRTACAHRETDGGHPRRVRELTVRSPIAFATKDEAFG